MNATPPNFLKAISNIPRIDFYLEGWKYRSKETIPKKGGKRDRNCDADISNSNTHLNKGEKSC
jgi:hypothetical protein